MIPEFLSPFANHLWQSTVFAIAVALLTLALRKNRAQIRYWLWLAASLKFLIPFSLLVSMGHRFEWRSAPTVPPPVSMAVERISEPFTSQMPVIVAATPDSSVMPTLLAAVWLIGFAVVLATWWVRWRRMRRAIQSAVPLPIQAPIKVMSAPTLLEPGVFGVFRPVLLLPAGIGNRLAPAQLSAIVAHELCHVRRRDNFVAAVHVLVEALFWFHPLAWWIGARLVEECERACDEEVLQLGNEPQEYAKGILNVCRFYLESPLACASGVTGADLKKRIEAIMTQHVKTRLTLGKKLLLASAAIATLAGPILAGLIQSQPETLTFEVASIKPSDPNSRSVSLGFSPGGGLRAINVGLKELIRFAYRIQCGKNCDEYISGGPGWINTQRFDILAKGSESEPAKMEADQRKDFQDRVRQRLQALLTERFQLVLRREVKEMPVYILVIGKNGHKMKETTSENGSIRGGGGEMIGENASMEGLVMNLVGMLGRPVVDRTGLKGRYNFRLEYGLDFASKVWATSRKVRRRTRVEDLRWSRPSRSSWD